MDLSTDKIFLNTVGVCATDVTTKQKILLTCPLSKRLAFWGVRMMPPAHSPEVISMAMAGIDHHMWLGRNRTYIRSPYL